MYNILIVDDEKYIRDELAYIIEKFDHVKVLWQTGDPDEVLEKIEKLSIDIIFLDIKLRYENGLNLARKINDLSKKPAIILSTAYDQYAISGFELSVSDYILKPFSENRVGRAIEKAIGHLNNKQQPNTLGLKNKIAVHDGDKIILLSLHEAIYFQSDGNHSQVYTKNAVYSLTASLKKLEQQLSGQSFKRISKTHIVNIEKITEIIPWFNYKCLLKLEGTQEEIFISRNYYKNFKDEIMIQ